MRMGQILSEPITTKNTSTCESKLYRVGSSSMQGWRITMEDCHTHILSLPEDPSSAFFGVYDGHGGSTVAKHAGKHLHQLIIKRPEYNKNVPLAMRKAFLDMDNFMRFNSECSVEDMVGSTAVSIIIRDTKLYCANAGDSRAIASVNGKLDILSKDHKPNDATESSRIIAGGGYVELNRVNGNLALSRALGDFAYKRNSLKKAEDQIVTAYPDVEIRDIDENWEFVIIACDGIWDVMPNSEALDFCRERIAKGLTPEKICEDLMMACLAPEGNICGVGGDNMTVILVCFLHDKPYEELVQRCSSSLLP